MTTDRSTVLDLADSRYVLPSPPRGQGLLVTGNEESGVSVLQAGAIARALGQRFESHAQSLDLLLSEVRERLEQLDVSITEDSRAQLKGAVRDLAGVVDWCDALQQELESESSKAVAGLEPINLVELCSQVAAALQKPADPIAVLSSQQVIYWGDRSQLVHLVQKALALAWARTGEMGLRCLEVVSREGTACIRVCSRGEPVADIDTDIVDVFRSAADNSGVVVVPDEMGPGGAGFVMRLPG